jgi:hypothetical protein
VAIPNQNFVGVKAGRRAGTPVYVTLCPEPQTTARRIGLRTGRAGGVPVYAFAEAECDIPAGRRVSAIQAGRYTDGKPVYVAYHCPCEGSGSGSYYDIGCCGRPLPAVGGFNVYPNRLFVTVSPLNCPCLSSPITWPIDWNFTDSAWIGTGPAQSCGTPEFRVVCGSLPAEKWRGELRWGVCVDGLGNTGARIELNGVCDPVDVTGDLLLAGIGCCGVIAGSALVRIRVTE